VSTYSDLWACTSAHLSAHVVFWRSYLGYDSANMALWIANMALLDVFRAHLLTGPPPKKIRGSEMRR